MTGRYIVVFGRKQSAGNVRRHLESFQRGEGAPGVRAFEVGRDPAFRFSADDGVRHAPAFLADVPDTLAKLDWLKAEIARDLDVFARNPRRLLDLYFAFIRARLDEEAPALGAALEPLGGLFHIEDWVFAALRPMPNATIVDANNGAATDATFHDMVFWTGDRLIAIQLQGGATPSKAAVDATNRLRRAGVDIVELPIRELVNGVSVFSSDRFPDEFRSFWQGVAYPCSPFRPQGLSETLSAI